MDVYIHIGTEKTGTTSLQNFFHENRSRFAERGICYPKSPGIEKHFSLSIYCRSTDVRDDLNVRTGLTDKESIRQFKKELPQMIEQEVSSLEGRERKLIFSSEHLSSRLLKTEDIQKLKELCSPFSSNPRIIVYLRRQDDYLVSTYSTFVKSGLTETFTIPEMSEEVERRYNYFDLLAPWSNVFGEENIIVRIYDRSLLFKNDIIFDFLHLSEINIDDSFHFPERSNESFGYKRLEYLRLMNEHIPVFVDNKLNSRRKGLVYILGKISGDNEPMVPDDAELRRFYHYFSDSNAQVAKKYLKQDDGVLFKVRPIISRKSTKNDSLTVEDSIAFSSKIWQIQNERIEKYRAWISLLKAELLIWKNNFTAAESALKLAAEHEANYDEVKRLQEVMKKRKKKRDSGLVTRLKRFFNIFK